MPRLGIQSLLYRALQNEPVASHLGVRSVDDGAGDAAPAKGVNKREAGGAKTEGQAGAAGGVPTGNAKGEAGAFDGAANCEEGEGGAVDGAANCDAGGWAALCKLIHYCSSAAHLAQLVGGSVDGKHGYGAVYCNHAVLVAVAGQSDRRDHALVVHNIAGEGLRI